MGAPVRRPPARIHGQPAGHLGHQPCDSRVEQAARPAGRSGSSRRERRAVRAAAVGWRPPRACRRGSGARRRPRRAAGAELSGDDRLVRGGHRLVVTGSAHLSAAAHRASGNVPCDPRLRASDDGRSGRGRQYQRRSDRLRRSVATAGRDGDRGGASRWCWAARAPTRPWPRYGPVRRTFMVGAVGDDLFADLTLDTLTSEGIDTVSGAGRRREHRYRAHPGRHRPPGRTTSRSCRTPTTG